MTVAALTPDIARRSNLTHAQLLIWTGQRLNADAPLYNMALTFAIEGPIDAGLFRRAFQHVVDRCDALRTVVDEVDGSPRLRVKPRIVAHVQDVDLSDRTDPNAALREWATARCQGLFVLTEGLFETALIKLADQRFAWYLCQHHLITDALSFTLIYSQINAEYVALRRGAASESAPMPSFQAFAEFERRARENERAAGYWRQKQADAGPPPQLYGRRSSRRSTRTERVSVDLGVARSAALRRLAGDAHFRALTPHQSLFGLFATLLIAYLARTGDQRTIAIGVPTPTRPTPAFKATAGLFIELFPLVVSVNETDTFASLCGKVHLETNALLRFAQPGTSDARTTRGVSAVLNYITASFGDFAGYPVRSEWLHPGHGDRGHEVRLQVQDFDATGQFALHFDFSCEVFDPGARGAAVGHVLRMIDAVLHDWNRPLESIDLLSDRERETLLFQFTGSDARDGSRRTVVQQFDARASETPTATALLCGDEQITYATLRRRANHLACLLRDKGIGPGAHVGICMPRSADAVTAMLAVHKAGAAYVPIDPSYPRERIAFMYEDSRARLVLTQQGVVDKLPPLAQTVCVDDHPLEAHDRDNETPVVGWDAAAYVIYTSGSTGRPKGVVISQGALANYVSWAAKTYAGSEKLTFPLFSPLSFDLTVTSIFVPLTTGGVIAVYPEATGTDLSLLDVIRDDRVDVIKLTPSHLALLQHADVRRSRVRQLILGGEDLTVELAQRTRRAFGGGVRIHNEYGPTEATVGCVLHTFDPATDTMASVPIGLPIDNMRAYVLNSCLSPVPQGVTGELYVAGSGLATGYWNRPDLTSERFVANPFWPGHLMYRTGDLARVGTSGVLECLGRQDGQVKIRGARVECGELEAALLAHPRVESCVVSVVDPPSAARSGHVSTCSRCGLPSNYPGMVFDDEAVCHLCRAFDRYQGRARQYFRSMDDLRAIFHGSRRDGRPQYDCLVLLSGGKDSTYALCQLVDMGLSVLAFTLDNGYISDQAKANIRRVVATLGVDHTFASTPAMNEIFVDSLKRHANVCHGCFKTIYTLSLTLAKEKGIRYVVTGLSRGQFFETRLTEELFAGRRVDVERIDETILEARKAYHHVDDAVSRLLDVGVFKDDRVFDEVRVLDFYRYCAASLDEMLAYLNRRVPWIRPSDTGRSTNCLINDVGIYVHRRQRGYHNYAFPYSWDVRMGHKTREAALAELNDQIDEPRAQRILRDIGYGELADPAEKRLVAYYVATGNLQASELRRLVAGSVPEFMMPTHFMQLDAIPLTPNGKVDRAALPLPGVDHQEADPAFVPPRTVTEQRVAAMWCDVLRIPRVGLRDDFLELGGHSLLAIQIVARINDAFQIDVPIAKAFEARTVAQMAAVVEAALMDEIDALGDQKARALLESQATRDRLTP